MTDSLCSRIHAYRSGREVTISKIVSLSPPTHTVLAGEAEGVKSPLQTLTPVRYLAFHQQPGAKITHDLPRDWNAFIYVITGTVAVGELMENLVNYRRGFLWQGFPFFGGNAV